MTAKEQVLQVYKDAYSIKVMTVYFVKSDEHGNMSSLSHTETSAWQSALDHINKTKSNDPTIHTPCCNTQAKEA